MSDPAERARLVARLRRKGTYVPPANPAQGHNDWLPDDDAIEAAALLESDGLAGETEREKVVKYLRCKVAEVDLKIPIPYGELMEWIEAIERGEHLK